MITIRNYTRVKTLEEAYQLNQKPGSKVAGGMMWIRLGNQQINHLIDLTDLNLDYIREEADQFVIGAYTSLRTLETSKALNEYTSNAIQEAVKHIVGTQFRNMATVGGSIYGRFGFSDVLTVFMALDCYVELYKGGIVPIAEFVNMNYDKDILVNVIVKKTPIKVVYQSVRNTVTDFPVLTCAVAESDGTRTVVVGARPKKAMIVKDEKDLLTELNLDTIQKFSEYAKETVSTESNARGSKEYRSHLVKVLVRRCLTQLMEEQ